MKIDTYQISICTDCLIWHANADDTGFCDCTVECVDEHHHAIREAKQLGNMPPVRSVIVGGDGDGYFSSSRCDGCGTTLGGDRHDVALITHN